MTQQITDLPALWQEAEQHIRAFEQLARRTVEEAWLAGDALLRIKDQLPHGAWTPALRERGIPVRTAQRFLRLRQNYPEKRQIVAFASVSAALTKSRPAEKPPESRPIYVVSADDLWDWQLMEVTALARRLLDEDELTVFSGAVTNVIRQHFNYYEDDEKCREALGWFRLALSCIVDIGPLEKNADAMNETERRYKAFFGSHLDWVANQGDFFRIGPRKALPIEHAT
ncbi:MAG: hypothetical protein F4047_03020 [Caldilineaceae bacterium SB0670_bin_27]|uniref:Uncharacterized protein n=1 Tax=Caldilineaceae bacterium SB0664_bin_27 TaxID=2605260 RepID=A0A6B0YMP9_9CHLR|nr:hypothetical protein [Caldilineaceae bacterium SB0664_bin_27]MYJ77131.1 hypothetical protein [Caldilineaceae bacterium SB0670_bin_27]